MGSAPSVTPESGVNLVKQKQKKNEIVVVVMSGKNSARRRKTGEPKRKPSGI